MELTLFVSKMTGDGLKTGKLLCSSDAGLDGRENNWNHPVELQSSWQLAPILWAEEDDTINCGRIHFRIELGRGGA